MKKKAQEKLAAKANPAPVVEEVAIVEEVAVEAPADVVVETPAEVVVETPAEAVVETPATEEAAE
jgi:small subunit ribosomal protein S16